MFIRHFVYWGTLELFPPLAIVNHAIMKICGQVSVPVPTFKSFGYYTGVNKLSCMVIVCLVFEELPNCKTIQI